MNLQRLVQEEPFIELSKDLYELGFICTAAFTYAQSLTSYLKMCLFTFGSQKAFIVYCISGYIHYIVLVEKTSKVQVLRPHTFWSPAWRISIIYLLLETRPYTDINIKIYIYGKGNHIYNNQLLEIRDNYGKISPDIPHVRYSSKPINVYQLVWKNTLVKI